MGLLDDHMEYIECIKEASLSGSGYYLRSLFATMLLTETLSRPEVVWDSTWEYLSDDILHNQRKRLNCPKLTLNDQQIRNLSLSEIETFLLLNNSTLKDFSTIPYPDNHSVASSNNCLILDELSYDCVSQHEEFNSLFSSLTTKQHGVFDNMMKAIDEQKGGLFFVYGYGGTGKTFLWRSLSTALRSKGKIVLNVASSGIASLLLTGGRTAHSRIHIPLKLNEDSMCFIKPDTDISNLIKDTTLIIWDEAPMVHKHAFEALDVTFKDVLRCDDVTNSELPFGGKVFVFGGDFRQILHVVANGSRHDIVNTSLSSSYLWPECKVIRLTKNMRLVLGGDPSNIEQTTIFANWLLDIGEGKLGGSNDSDALIEIPNDLLITQSNDPIDSLIEFVYHSFLQHYNDPIYFQERALLAPKNEVVHEINDRLLSLFPGEEK